MSPKFIDKIISGVSTEIKIDIDISQEALKLLWNTYGKTKESYGAEPVSVTKVQGAEGSHIYQMHPCAISTAAKRQTTEN